MKYSLATRWTSFVAVSRRVVNYNPENSKDAPVPLPMVKGVTYKAYPSILAGNMVGHSVPEPKTLAGLFIICAAGFLAMWFIRRKIGMVYP